MVVAELPSTIIAELKSASTAHVRAALAFLDDHLAFPTLLELKFIFQVLDLSLITFSIVILHHAFQTVCVFALFAGASLFFFLDLQNPIFTCFIWAEFSGRIF